MLSVQSIKYVLHFDGICHKAATLTLPKDKVSSRERCCHLVNVRQAAAPRITGDATS